MKYLWIKSLGQLEDLTTIGCIKEPEPPNFIYNITHWFGLQSESWLTIELYQTYKIDQKRKIQNDNVKKALDVLRRLNRMVSWSHVDPTWTIYEQRSLVFR